MEYQTNKYAVLLKLLGLDRYYPTLKRVLQPLGQAILTAGDALSDKELTDLDPDYLEVLVDEETWIIENLLGASFITCQTHISLVVSHVKNIHKYVAEEGITPLSCCKSDKFSILVFGSPHVGKSCYTKVQVIDAAANYFKHRSEWDPQWKDLDKKQQKTAKVLMALEVSPGCTGNLRTISEALGNSRYNETEIFASAVMDWHEALENEHRKELRQRGLVGDGNA